MNKTCVNTYKPFKDEKRKNSAQSEGRYNINAEVIVLFKEKVCFCYGYVLCLLFDTEVQNFLVGVSSKT